MSKPKKVAQSLKGILENPIMKVVLDRSKDIETVLDEVNSWWGYDLLNRKPGPAYIDEDLVGTDLDLSCFLYELAQRNAVINIPEYKSMRATKLKEGQAIVSKDNRHGQILGLTANKDVFSFSVRVKDMNVITSEGVGDYRNFSLTDLDGDWYEGWGNLEFIPNAVENKFIFENKIETDGAVLFKNFVHPNRWSSIFGQYYFITKALVTRMKEESTYYNKEIKSMLESGIQYPPKDAPPEWPESTKIPGKKIKVKSFEIDLSIPENNTEYTKYEYNVENLVELTKKRKYFTYKVAPNLNFALRTCEFAYHKFGKNRIPHWLKNVTWEENYVIPGKRIKWDRIVLFQEHVGQEGISIKKRLYETTQEVAEGYDNRKGKLKSYIAFVLDESGSMGVIKEEIIGAFNQQVKVIKDNSSDIDTRVSLVTFNTVVPKPKLWNETDSSLKNIDSKIYQPQGMTALNDAIGITIDKLKDVEDYNDPLTSFLLIVLSDGQENNSKRYPGLYNQEISKKIKEVQDTNRWTVTFIGANQDMNEVAKNLNISTGNVSSFVANSRGVQDSAFKVSLGINSYYGARRSGQTSVKDFYQKDQDKQ